MDKNDIRTALDKARAVLDGPHKAGLAIQLSRGLEAASRAILDLPKTDPDRASLKAEALDLVNRTNAEYFTVRP